NTVQAVLSGRKASTVPKKKHNPSLPLKSFVRCGSCGNPITGGFATGKNKAKKYGFYWCYRPKCRAVKVAKQELESAFIAHMKPLHTNKKTLAAFPKAAAQMWAERQGDSEAYTKKLTARLDEQKRLKSELLKAKLRGEVSQSDYAEANLEFETEIRSLQRQ